MSPTNDDDATKGELSAKGNQPGDATTPTEASILMGTAEKQDSIRQENLWNGEGIKNSSSEFHQIQEQPYSADLITDFARAHDLEQGKIEKLNLHDSHGLNETMGMLGFDAHHQRPTDANKDQQKQHHVPDFDDYLRAQRFLKMKSRRGSVNNLGMNIHDAEPDKDIGSSRHSLVPEQLASTKVVGSPSHGKHGGGAAGNENLNGSNQFLDIPDSSEAGMDNRFDRVRVAKAVMDLQASFHILDEGAGGAGEQNGENHDGEKGRHHRHSDISEIPWYCNPVQRQRWGDDQALPHVNWGDLFFDLFYVAAAYNLGVLLISALNAKDWPRGVVYFIGIFGPLYNTWEIDTYYSSRYTVVDHFHRMFDVLRFVLVGSIVLHIKTLEKLSDTSSVETFALMVSLFLESLMQTVLHLELAWCAQGDRTAIYNHTTRKLKYQSIPLCVVYLAAAVVAGVFYFQNNDNGSTRDDNDDYNSSSTGWGVADIPYFLTMAAYVLSICSTAIRKLLLSSDKSHDIRDHFVPNNVDYLIHRYGEWVILMIGESILSLLIVETVESEDYYIIALVGVLTVILVQTLKFESEPNHPEGHALLQSVKAATAFTVLIQILSMGLISFGVSFKVMLTLVKSDIEDYDDGDYRNLAESQYISESAASALFCGSLATVLVSLELLLITHHGGIQGAWEALFKGEEGNIKKLNYPLLFIHVAKLALIAFMATMCLWQSDPRSIASAGFLVVTALAFSRIAGWGVVNKEDEIKQFIAAMEDTTRNMARIVEDATKDVARSVARTATSVAAVAVAFARSDSDSIFADEGQGFDKSVWDRSFDSIIIMDKTGKIGDVNATTLSMFGYERPSELKGKSIALLVDESEEGYHAQYLQAFSESERASIVIGREEVLSSTRKDGSQFPCIICIKKLPGNGDIVGYIRNMTGVIGRKNEDDLAVDPVLRLVDETSFDCIVVIDRDGIIQHVNMMTLSEFGYDFKDELIGSNVSILVGSAYADKHDKYVERFHKKNKTDTVIGERRNLKSRRKDGSEFPCLVSINTIPNSTLMIGYIRNMTGASKTERALQAEELSALGKLNSESVFADEEQGFDKSVWDKSFDAIIIMDQTGTIKDVNATTLSLFGYRSTSKLQGENIKLLIGEAGEGRHAKYFKEFKESGKISAVFGKEQELLCIRKDGSQFPSIVCLKKLPGKRDIVGYIRNMTGVVGRRTEDDLKLDPVLRLVDEASFDSIVVIDTKGIIHDINMTTLSEFGYDFKDELIGSNVSILVGGPYADKHDKYVERFRKEQRSDTVIGKRRILKSRRKDGSEFPCLVSINTIPKSKYLIGYIRNMTGASKSERFLQAGELSALGKLSSESVFADEGQGFDKSMWDRSFDSIIIMDEAGTIKDVNATTLSLFGYESSSKLKGENIKSLVSESEAGNYARYLEEFIESGKMSVVYGKEQELHCIRKDGSQFPSIICIKQVPGSRDIVGYIRNMTGVMSRRTENDLAVDPVLRLVDETSFDCIIVIDKAGLIQHVNMTTLSEFGYDFKDELVGSNISLLVGGHHASKHDKYLQRFHKNNKSDTVIGKRRNLKSRRRDGSEFPCLVSISTIPDSDCLIGYIRNMTGVSKSQRYLQADDMSSQGKQTAEEFLEDSFDSIIVASEDGTILRVNQTALETFRYESKDELLGQNLSILVGGGEHKKHDRYLRKFKKAGTMSSTIGKQRILFSRRKDGTEFPCIVGIKKMRDSTNLVGFIRDMTNVQEHDDKAVEITNISHLNPIKRLIDDQSFDCIIVINTDGIINKVNQTAVVQFGYSSKEDLVGKNISTLVGGGQADNHDTFMERFKEKGGKSSVIGKQRKLYSKRKDGSEFPCIIAIRTIPDTDFLVGYIRNMEDLPNENSEQTIQHMEVIRYIDDNSFDCIIVTNKDGVIEYLNITTLSEFGYDSKDELVGQNISVLVGGGHGNRHGKYMEEFFKNNKSDSIIGKQRALHSRKKDGTEFPCLIGIKKVPNTDFLIGYIRNMSGFQAEPEVSKIDQHLSRSVHSTDLVYGTSDSQLDNYDDDNDDDDGNNDNDTDGDNGNTNKDYDDNNNDNDVGDDERDSQQSSSLKQYIDERSFDCIVITDMQGMIKAVNQTCIEEFGYDSKDELIGNNVSLLVGGGKADKHDGYMKKFREADRTGTAIGIKRRLHSRRKDGSEFPCFIGIKRIPEEDLLIGYITNASEDRWH